MKKKIAIIITLLVFNSLIFNSISILGFIYSSSYTEIGSIASGTNIISMRFTDNDLAFLVEMDRGLAVYDVSKPWNCIEQDFFPLSFVHDIELDLERKLIYVTASNGVNIFNFTDPTHLDLLSVYKNYTSSRYIQLKGDLLFVGAEEKGLQIVDVSNATNPTMLGSWTDSIGQVGPVYILNNYAFVGIYTPNNNAPPNVIDLKLLDVSDPKHIAFVSTVNTGLGYAGGAPKAHYHDFVYLNDYENGLKILDFSDPSNVSVLGAYFDGGSINDVTLVDNEIAFLADDDYGLKIINCTNPENPFKIGSYEHQWKTIRVAVEDDKAYLGTQEGGVRIITAETNSNAIPINPIFICCNVFIGSLLLLYIFKKKSESKTKYSCIQ